MTKVTWKGEKNGPDEIEQFGHVFPKGEAVEVDADHPQIEKFRGNPHFEVEGEGGKGKTKGKTK